jgi:spore coat polysaccharide biosynthesis protein SpsF
VQLGIDYGAANQGGRPSDQEAEAIVKLAIERGVAAIDTARAYGDSEERLGKILAGDLARRVHIYTKLDPMQALPADADERTVFEAVDASVYRSCAELRLSSLPTLLLHRWSHYRYAGGAIWRRLLALRSQGVIDVLGTSVYSPEEALEALAEPNIGHLQIPFNLLDWRWDAAAFGDHLAKRPDITVHARSIFLQGILISGADSWPLPAHEAEGWIRTLSDLADEFQLSSRAELCLAYAKAHRWITSFLVGVETVDQLRRNLDLIHIRPLEPAQVTRVNTSLTRAPDYLINPSLWPVRRR